MQDISSFVPGFYLWTLLMIKYLTIEITQIDPGDVTRKGSPRALFADTHWHHRARKNRHQVGKSWKTSSVTHFRSTEHRTAVQGGCMRPSSRPLNRGSDRPAFWNSRGEGGAVWRARLLVSVRRGQASPGPQELRERRNNSLVISCIGVVFSCSTAASSRWRETWLPPPPDLRSTGRYHGCPKKGLDSPDWATCPLLGDVSVAMRTGGLCVQPV